MNTQTNTHPVVDYVLNYYLPHLPLQLQNANMADRQRLINESWEINERLEREEGSYDPLQFANWVCGLFIGVNSQHFWDAIDDALSDCHTDEDERGYEICNFNQFFQNVDFPLGEALFSDGFLARCVEYHAENPDRGEGRLGNEMPSVSAIMHLRTWWINNGGKAECLLYPEYLDQLDESEA